MKTHLNYNQFRQVYGNYGVTDWVKYNWLEVAPKDKTLVEPVLEEFQEVPPTFTKVGTRYYGYFDGTYDPIKSAFPNSQFEYGSYLVNSIVNRADNNGYIWVRNVTKSINIFNLKYNGTFQLTPSNYSKGDEIWVYVHSDVNSGYIDISNIFIIPVEYGLVDLGTLDYNINSDWNGAIAFYNTSLNIIMTSLSIPADIYASGYVNKSRNDLYDQYDKAIGVSGSIPNGQLTFRDPDYTDVTSFKDHLAGTQLLYKLAEVE